MIKTEFRSMKMSSLNRLPDQANTTIRITKPLSKPFNHIEIINSLALQVRGLSL
jgi:hypothetical protein